MGKELFIITQNEDEVAATRGGKAENWKLMSAKDLSKQLHSFQEAFEETIEKLKSKKKSARLTEVSVHVEINASGKVGIMGSGVSTGAKGGLTLKYVFD